MTVPTHVRVRGVPYELPQSLTMAEVSEIQAISNVDFRHMGKYLAEGDPDAILAVVFIAMRRKNPNTRLETVRGLAVEEIGLS